MIRKSLVEPNRADAYCSCHDPACRGGGHCVDNITAGLARRPTRADLMELLSHREALQIA